MDAASLHGRTILVAQYANGENDWVEYRFLRGRGHSQATGFLVIAESMVGASIPEHSLQRAVAFTETLRDTLILALPEHMLAGVEFLIATLPRASNEERDDGYTIYGPIRRP